MKTPLPPDPEAMNDARAEWALSALEAMSSETGCDLAEALPDLLCNLQHLCDRRPEWDFEQALRMARASYAEETDGAAEAL